jgi:membrane-associated phospholipid phosphatase
MSRHVSVAVVVTLLATARLTGAQTLTGQDLVPAAGPGDSHGGSAPVAATASDQGLVLPPATPPIAPPGGITFGAPTPRSPFTSIGHDLKTFFTNQDTVVVMSVFAPAAGVAFTWDQAGIEESQEHLQGPAFTAGNIGGSFFVQTGAAVGTWAIGAITGNERTKTIGGDLVRAQLVSQVVVQGVKLATQRERPDGSNQHSFPSGHTSSAFATASVLNRHLGWKAGLPAYGFAAFVGVSRMSANKHHMSDVIMGAAVGIAAGRAVTVGVGGTKFDLGVAPTQGGAAVTFTKR